jgi:ferredoxin
MPVLLNWLDSLDMDINVTSKCSRLTNRMSTCSGCLQQCRSQAIILSELSVKIDPNKCNECGDCLIGCPLSAIEGVGTKRVVEQGSLVYDDSFTPMKKELLIYKKRGIKSILIDQFPLNQKWEKVLNEANEILTILDEHPITVKKKNNNEIISRRAFFSMFGKEGKKFVKNITPASWEYHVDEWNLANFYPQYQFFTVKIDKTKCTFCKVCFSICVQEVFILKAPLIRIENEKCVNCRSCTDICPEQAIEIKFDIKSESHETIHTKECRECGSTFHTFQTEIVLCHICLNRDLEWLSPYSTNLI